MPYDSLYSHGFARVAAAVPHLRPAEPVFNAERTLALAEQASENHAALVVFPELGISAYAIDDLLHQRAVTDAVLEALGSIAEASRELRPVLIVGAPLWAERGLFNCAVAIHRGRVLGVAPKSYLPDYHEYYEERQFRAAREAIGDEITLLGQTVPFGNNILFAASDLPDFVGAIVPTASERLLAYGGPAGNSTESVLWLTPGSSTWELATAPEGTRRWWDTSYNG